MNVGKYLITACIASLMMPLAACSTGLDLRATTTKARIATMEAQSWRVKGTASYTSEDEALETTWEGEFAAPDRSRVKITTETGLWCEAIEIGEQSYVRTSDMPEWGSGVRGIACVLLPITEVLEPLDSLIDFQQLPDDEIDNVQCTHYRGKVDVDSLAQKEQAAMGDRLPPEVLDLMRRGSMEVELWVGKDDYLIRQMRRTDHLLELKAGTGEEKWTTQSTIIRFYDFNEPIAIDPPALQPSGSGD